MPEGRFTLTVRGFHARGPEAALYDPIQDRAAPCRLNPLGEDRAEIELSVTDYPRLLVTES